MIKIVPSGPVLEQIRRDHPTWLGRAEAKRVAAVAAGKVGDGDGIWSDIKGIFIREQHYKCGYCEEAMAKIKEGETEGIGIDYDVEHFRPKNRVAHWPTPEALSERPGIDYAQQIRSGDPAGYVRLAFDPLNYLVSCKLCNSFYKGDRFPIAGRPESMATTRADLDAIERPCLLFPFGNGADDPEEFFTFTGPSISPRSDLRAEDRLRARVVIDFLELDSREDLLLARSRKIVSLYPQLEQLPDPEADDFVRAEQGARSPHSACARAFVQLYAEDRALADRFYRASRAFVISKGR